MNIDFSDILPREMYLLLQKIKDDDELNAPIMAREMALSILSKYESDTNSIEITKDGRIIRHDIPELSEHDIQLGINLIKKHCTHLLSSLFRVEGIEQQEKALQYYKDHGHEFINQDVESLAITKSVASGYMDNHLIVPPTEAFGCPSDDNAISVTGNNFNVLLNPPENHFTINISSGQALTPTFEHPTLKDSSNDPIKFIDQGVEEIELTFSGSDVIDPSDTGVYKFDGVQNIALGHMLMTAQYQFGRNTWNILGEDPYDGSSAIAGGQALILDEQGDPNSSFSRSFYLATDKVPGGRDVDEDLRFNIGVPTMQVSDDGMSAKVKGLGDIDPFLQSTKFPGRYLITTFPEFTIPDSLPYPGDKGLHMLYSKPRVSATGGPLPENLPNVSSCLSTETDVVAFETVSHTDLRLNMYYVHERGGSDVDEEVRKTEDTVRPYVSTGGPNYVLRNTPYDGVQYSAKEGGSTFYSREEFYHCFDAGLSQPYKDKNHSNRFRKYIVEIINFGDNPKAGHASFTLDIYGGPTGTIVDVTNLTDLSTTNESYEMTTGFLGPKNQFKRKALHPGSRRGGGGSWVGLPVPCLPSGIFSPSQFGGPDELHCIEDISFVYAGMPVFGPYVPDGAFVQEVHAYDKGEYPVPLSQWYNQGTAVPGYIVLNFDDERVGTDILETTKLREYIHPRPDEPEKIEYGVQVVNSRIGAAYFENIFFSDPQNIRGGDGYTILANNHVRMNCILRCNRPLWTDSKLILASDVHALSNDFRDSTKTTNDKDDIPRFTVARPGDFGVYAYDPYSGYYDTFDNGVRLIDYDLTPFYRKYTDAQVQLILQTYANDGLTSSSADPLMMQQCSQDYMAFMNAVKYERPIHEWLTATDGGMGTSDNVVMVPEPAHKADYITRMGADNPYTALFGGSFRSNNKPRFSPSRSIENVLPESPFNAMLRNYPYDPRAFLSIYSQHLAGGATFSTTLSHPFGSGVDNVGLSPYQGEIAGFRPHDSIPNIPPLVGINREGLPYPRNYPYFDACTGYYYGDAGYAQLLVTVDGELSGILRPPPPETKCNTPTQFKRTNAMSLRPHANIFLDNRHINKIRPTGVSSTGIVTLENGSSDTCYQYASIESEPGDVPNRTLVPDARLDDGLDQKYGENGLLISTTMKSIRPDGRFFGGFNPCKGSILQGERNFRRVETSGYFDPNTRVPPGPYCEVVGEGHPYMGSGIAVGAADLHADVCDAQDPYFCCENCKCTPYSAAKGGNPQLGKLGYDKNGAKFNQSAVAPASNAVKLIVYPCEDNLIQTGFGDSNFNDNVGNEWWATDELGGGNNAGNDLTFDPDTWPAENGYPAGIFVSTNAVLTFTKDGDGPDGCCRYPASQACPEFTLSVGGMCCFGSGVAANMTIACTQSTSYGGLFSVSGGFSVDCNSAEVVISANRDPRAPEWNPFAQAGGDYLIDRTEASDFDTLNNGGDVFILGDDGTLPGPGGGPMSSTDFFNRENANTLQWLSTCGCNGSATTEGTFECPGNPLRGVDPIGEDEEYGGDDPSFWTNGVLRIITIGSGVTAIVQWEYENLFFQASPNNRARQVAQRLGYVDSDGYGTGTSSAYPAGVKAFTDCELDPNEGNICRRDEYGGEFPAAPGGGGGLGSLAFPITKGCRGSGICFLPTPEGYIDNPSNFDPSDRGGNPEGNPFGSGLG